MVFVPTQAPEATTDEGREIVKWAELELQRLTQSLQESEGVPLNELNAAPAKPREGQAAFADGTNWNPGSGRGPYMYVNGVWTFTGYVVPQDLSPYLTKADNLASVASAATSRSNLGLGTAAVLNVGTGASQVVQLDGSAKLPAVDGSQLTGLATTGRLFAGTPLVLNPFALSSTTTQAHGLGAEPICILGHWENLIADLGYSVGDKVFISETELRFSIVFNATNLVLTVGSVQPLLVNKSTYSIAGSFTVANWKLTFVPYKLL